MVRVRFGWLTACAAGLALVGCAGHALELVAPRSAPPTPVSSVPAEASTAPSSESAPTEISTLREGGSGVTRQLDPVVLQTRVREVLTEPPPGGYGLTEVGDIACPAGRTATAGATVTCAVTMAGEDELVVVRVLDDQGRFEIGPPA